MKTERRHELQTNELADWLGTTIQFIEANYRTVLGVIVALAVVVGAGFYLKSESATRRGQAWDRYFQAQNAQNPLDEMLTVADNYDGTAAASWAKLTVADSQLAIGTDQLFRDRAEANNQLRKAATNYQDIAESSLAASEPLLAQRAVFGLARTYESLGELDKAKAEYDKLTDKSKWPHPIFAIEAQRRIKSLGQPSTKAFYDWFARQETKVEQAAPATSGIDDIEKLPDESEFKSSAVTPESPPADAAAGASAAESTEIATPPATEIAPAEGTASAATEPAATAPPAEPAPPAAEQPPGESPATPPSTP